MTLPKESTEELVKKLHAIDKDITSKIEYCILFHAAVKKFFAEDTAASMGQLYAVLTAYEKDMDLVDPVV